MSKVTTFCLIARVKGINVSSYFYSVNFVTIMSEWFHVLTIEDSDACKHWNVCYVSLNIYFFHTKKIQKITINRLLPHCSLWSTMTINSGLFIGRWLCEFYPFLYIKFVYVVSVQIKLCLLINFYQIVACRLPVTLVTWTYISITVVEDKAKFSKIIMLTRTTQVSGNCG
jgi:hypothetical protein